MNPGAEAGVGPDAGAAPRAAGGGLWTNLGLTLVLAALAVVGNGARVPLFFGTEFLFGGVAVVLALNLVGFRAGLAVAFVSAAQTVLLWGHPYAGLAFLLEAAVLGWARQRRWNQLILDFVYWVLLGGPMILFFYSVPLGLDFLSALLTALKDAVNGLLYVLIALLLLNHTPLGRLGRARGEVPPFAAVLFNLVLAVSLFPAVGLIGLGAANQFRAAQAGVASRLHQQAQDVATDVLAWRDRQLSTVQSVAAAAAVLPLGPDPNLQRILDVAQSGGSSLRSVLLLDGRGRVVAASPGGPGAFPPSLAGEPFFQRALAARHPVTTVAFQEATGRFRAAVAAPVLTAQGPRGVAAADLDLSDLWALVGRLAGGVRVTVTSADGHVLLSTSGLTPGALYAPPKGLQAVPVEANLQRWEPAGSAPPVQRWSTSVLVASRAVSPTLAWAVHVQAPLKAEIEAVRAQQARLLGFILALAAALLLISAQLTRGVTASVRDLAQVTRDLPERLLEGGDPSWPASRVAEVAVLTENFQDMSASLRQSIREYQRLNARLEERVAQRTQELEARNAEAEQFIYTVSHDLRTPLLSIQGMSELLGESVRGHDPAETEHLLGRIQANTARMGQLLSDLLAFSRIGRVDLEPVELRLAEPAQAALGELEARVQARGLLLEAPERWPVVCLPRSEAYQVLANLLGNAVKFATRRVRVSWGLDGGTLSLRVEDDGPGVPVEYREKVFDLFQKLDAKGSGTGVGLAIVKRIAERHAGRAWIEDSPLGGASVNLILNGVAPEGESDAAEGQPRPAPDAQPAPPEDARLAPREDTRPAGRGPRGA